MHTFALEIDKNRRCRCPEEDFIAGSFVITGNSPEKVKKFSQRFLKPER